MNNSPPVAVPFPLIPRNAYFAALKAQYDLASTTPADTARLVLAQEETTAQLVALREALPNAATTADTLNPLVLSVDRLNATVGSFDRSEVDYVTALYAAAVETTGLVVVDTLPGQWLNAAWRTINPKSSHDRFAIGDIGTLATKPAQLRKFLAELRETADRYPGLSQRLTPEDLLRFARLATGVADAIQLAARVPYDASKDASTIPDGSTSA